MLHQRIGTSLALRIALALALLAASPPLFLMGSPGATSAPAAPPAAPPQGPLAEHEVWWNEGWAQILDLSGAWEVRTGESYSTLRPRDPSCKVVILARGTGEVFDYAMHPDGEVLLAFGWIMISPRKLTLVGARPETGVDSKPYQSGIQGVTYRPIRIERITWRGNGDWLVRDLHSSRYHVTVTGPEEPAPARNQIVVHTIAGETRVYPNDEQKSCYLAQEKQTAAPSVEIAGLSR